MVKVAQRYLEVNPWKIVEKGYHEERHQVSESLFSLSNEYMGVRGFFDEGYNGSSLIGTYYNGIYEVPKNINRSHYKGITEKQHYMVNSTNIFYTRLYLNDELYKFDPKEISEYSRSLDFKNGESIRTYKIKDLIKVTFKRILDLNTHQLSHQQIIITPLKYKGIIKLDVGLDLGVKHWGKPGFWKVKNKDERQILGETTTSQLVYNQYQLTSNTPFESEFSYKNKLNLETIVFDLNKEVVLEKTIVSLIDKQGKNNLSNFKNLANKLLKTASYSNSLLINTKFYEDFWNKNDIAIDGDPLNQQGIRYCLFQLLNTYHGVSETDNIGAKGLTGEAYSGHAFWDSETYCFPFYLFTNLKAAKNLLMFRYNTLENAISRAKELDCIGACYPIATLNGDEASDLWQHASLQFQPSTAVYYAIWHYVKNTGDEEFLINYGFEMLLEIARFMSSRGQYNQDGSIFGYYGVMGPDEFQLMVNHNAYTNLLGKKAMEYFLYVFDKYKNNPKIKEVVEKRNLKESEVILMEDQCNKMFIPYDEETKIYEQHLGFHDLPHIDIHSIPVTDFPLYSHWSYDRIYRNDLIKQPDVLMFMFLFNQSFDLETKQANYDYYEPKTIHESSLSPSIHSIFAAELGYEQASLDFFGFASRLDLDDYNRNTNEGLHLTSIAAAWVNIVYGFGGLRSDGDMLKLSPMLPKNWDGYQFNINYFGVHIKVEIDQKHVNLIVDKDLDKPIIVFNDKYYLKKGKTKVLMNVDN